MPDRPNVLLITTDQQRFDAAGERAPDFLRTPHYEMLCRQGVEFSAAYGSSPKCVPSRAEIMTGKSVFARADDDVNTGESYPHHVEGRDDTLPTLMREAGYQTAAVGKMHFHPVRARHGFDEMILPHEYYEEQHRAGGQQPMRHGLGQNEIHPARATVPESETLTNWITEECVDYIRRRRDPTVPFFLWCSFSKPHPPLDPPEPYYSMYQDADIPAPVESDWSDPPPTVIDRHPWVSRTPDPDRAEIEAARAAYYGLITQVDYNMGRVVAALRDDDLLSETLILYTADHGCYLGDHGLYNKMYFHDAAARVPMVVRRAGRCRRTATAGTCSRWHAGRPGGSTCWGCQRPSRRVTTSASPTGSGSTSGTPTAAASSCSTWSPTPTRRGTSRTTRATTAGGRHSATSSRPGWPGRGSSRTALPSSSRRAPRSTSRSRTTPQRRPGRGW
ncbi:MAG: sulfatase-like hydrolase/transferase [Halobacteriaceae archaeon]